MIIDDEQSGREILQSIITQFCPTVKIIGEADGVRTGEELILKQKPNVILLDVNMQDGTGFDLLKKLPVHDFKIIFITAFQEHAIKAFEFSAIDYLLKPVEASRLIDALGKASDIIERSDLELKLSSLLSNINTSPLDQKKIVLKTSERIYAVEIKEIIRCESDGSYTKFYLSDGKKILVSRQLKEFDDLLNGNPFIRVHQSHLININYFDYFEKSEDMVFMKDKTSVPVSTRKKDQLLKLISEI